MAGRPETHLPPHVARAAAIEVVRALRDAGHVAYLAGGCVRDELLGLSPTDYDVATDATPARITALFPRTAEVGASFGVVLVKHGAAVVEVATFRSDGPYSDRRRPDTVRFSTPEDDAQRRDFTVNALFMDPLDTTGREVEKTPVGRVIDYVGGEADLRARVLRAVGDPEQRLAEDHLRALRAVRFAARLGFAIDARTADAIRRHARDLSGVSRERIGDELRRMLEHPGRAEALRVLDELELDGPVLQESCARGDRPRVRGLGSDPVEFPTVLAALARDRGLPAEISRADGPRRQRVISPTADLVRRWRAALCLSNDESESLAGILRVLGRLELGWDDEPVASRKRLASSRWFASALRILTCADAPRADSVRVTVGELAQSHGGLAPEPYVTGDLLEASGLAPGPRFKTILDAVYDAQLEGRVDSSEAALRMALRIATEPGGPPHV